MEQEPSELKLIYNNTTGKITMEAYNEGFFNYELDITKEIMELAVEKLFDDMNCPENGGVVEITRKKEKRNGVIKVIGEIKSS